MKITRIGLSQDNIDNWLIGESKELKKWIGFSFNKTQVKKIKDEVTFIYNLEEIKQFEKSLEECFDELLFDKMCDRFFELMEEYNGDNKDSIERQMMPINTIFDELSKYPEWGNNRMMRRLNRIRTNYHDFIYTI